MTDNISPSRQLSRPTFATHGDAANQRTFSNSLIIIVITVVTTPEAEAVVIVEVESAITAVATPEAETVVIIKIESTITAKRPVIHPGAVPERSTVI